MAMVLSPRDLNQTHLNQTQTVPSSGYKMWRCVCLPEWTYICALECDLCILMGQSGQGLPQKAIGPKNMQFMYPKIWLHTVGR